MPPTRSAERRPSVTPRRPDDTRPDVLVARLAARRFGVLGLAELRACGLSEPGIRRRVHDGRLHRLHPGVYAVGHVGLPL